MRNAREKKTDLRIKLYLIMLVPLLAMGALIMWTTTTSSENASLTTIQHTNQQLAVNTSQLLGKESDKIKKLYNTASESSNEYKSLREELLKVRLQSGALYVYMYNHTTNGWVYTVDGASWDDKEYSPYGSEMDFDAPIEKRLLNGEVVTTGIANDPIWGKMLSTFTPIKDSNGAVIGYLGIDISAKAVNQISADTLANSYRMVIPIFATVLLLSLLIMLLMVRGILKQVSTIKSSLEQVAVGNLKIVSKRITKDQLGDISELVNKMVAQLTKILLGIQQGASMLQQSSSKIADTAQTNHYRLEELSRSIEEIAIGSTKQAEETEQSVENSENLGIIMDELGTYVHQFSDTSERLYAVQKLVTHEHEILLNKGKENVKHVEQLQEISRSLIEQSQLASSISDQVHKILKQTQILSLNASIEAARAGDAGKGFAVVAGEMGQLTRQSEQSIQEIDTILEAFVQETHRMVSHFDENIEVVKDQENQIVDCLQAFGQVSEISDEVQKLAHQLEDRNSDMRMIREEVEQHLSDIASATEETSAMTEEVATNAVEQKKASEQLSVVSTQLSELSGTLKSYADHFQIEAVEDGTN